MIKRQTGRQIETETDRETEETGDIETETDRETEEETGDIESEGDRERQIKRHQETDR